MNASDFVRAHAHHDRRVLTQHDRLNQDAIDQLLWLFGPPVLVTTATPIRSGSAMTRAESDRGVCQPASTFDPVPSAAGLSR